MSSQNDGVRRRDLALGAAGLLAAASPALAQQRPPGQASGAPAKRPEAAEEVSRYRWRWSRSAIKSVRSQGAMISTSSGGKSNDDALAIMRAGGNAADAALSMAIAQVVHAIGSWTTHAGILTLVYYEAKTGKIHSLNAGFNTVAGETDPMTIPARAFGATDVPQDIGRTVLVPGFMAGVEAAYNRFGSIPFARLFDSGIAIAEGGMVVDASMEDFLSNEAHLRLTETRNIFRKPNGATYKAGELFRQPALANTLRNVAQQGAAYMYTGAWAEKFVAGVRADGGQMSMADLANYAVQWGQPLHTNYKGYDVYSLQHCHFMHGGLRLAQESKLASLGRYYENPDVFYYYHKIFRATGTNMTIMGTRIDQLPVPPTDWLDPQKIAAYWPLIRDGRFPASPGGTNNPHTDTMVVVDPQGNVASLMHSTNGAATGLYVDGVSVPGPAGLQQNHVRKVGPGRPMPNMVPNTIVLKNKRPVFATAAAGHALHQETLKVITNLIDYGKSGRDAIQAPSFVEPFFSNAKGLEPDEVVLAGDYTEELLDAVREKGMPVTEFVRGSPGGSNPSAETTNRSSAASAETPEIRRNANLGIVALVVIDPKTGEREGVSPRFTGNASGF
ncbi:MAG: gamma-glutamyltransferase family protein [Phenylobacterium sp.]|uniref:gamma-glutamyltransferase n=1 Tax=Phenylobacterium sp. TaxID=1871053 RepID=UPI0025CC9C82|nr:gamma-glutamyltransferase [Phenylobacterium sp.]MCG9917540.1 gamma-glutamyltransferase family protein [Phenylobacterium sp.]